MKTRNLTQDEVKEVFYAARADLDMADTEMVPLPCVEFASACTRNGIIMFCKANDIPLPEGFPGRNDEQAAT